MVRLATSETDVHPHFVHNKTNKTCRVCFNYFKCFHAKGTLSDVIELL